MVITISETAIQIIGDPDIIFQGNNLVNTLAAVTDKDNTWEYNIDIFMPTEKRYNSIIMTRNANMLSVDLTRQMLPYNGRYVCQFRGTSVNGAVYHTDKFNIWVKDSIDLNEAYDPMPAEFYQMENKMKEILKQTQEAASETLPPISAETSGQYLTNDGTEAKWADVETGLTQEQADERYLQLTGGTMAGDVDMGDHNINKVSFVRAAGTYENAGIQFSSNGTIMNFITGYSTALELSANSVNVVNHNIEKVAGIEMSNNGLITGLGAPVNDGDATNKQYVDNAVAGVQTNIDTVSGTVNDILDGTETIPYLPDNGGTITGVLNMGNNKITMGGTPTETTDVTNKGYVDGVVKVVSDEVDGILAGTTPVAIPAATETHIGGIKPGAGTAVSGDGTLTIIVPVPTAEDNGKILVAENGVWVAKLLSEIQGSDNI